MPKARNQPFCRANNINLGYYNEDRLYPRTVTNRYSALFLYNNLFCSKWKSEGVSFIQALKYLKDNFNIVDNCITEETVNSYFKYEFIPNKIEPHLTNFFVSDLETHNTDRARPYCKSFYRLSKISGRYERDPAQEGLKKSIKDTVAFAGDNCKNNALEYRLGFKGEERKEKNKNVEYNLQLHAHNGSGFDTWIILNNLPCDKHIVDIIITRKGIEELKYLLVLLRKIKNKFPKIFILDVV